MQVYDSALRLDGGTETPQDLLILKKFYEVAQRNEDWGSWVVRGATDMIPFAIEIALSRTPMKKIQEGTEIIVMKTLKKLLKKTGKELLENKLANYSTKVGSFITAHAIRTRVNFAPRSLEAMARKMIPAFEIGYDDEDELVGMVTAPGMNMTEAYKWAYVETFIEVLSEQAGEWLR